MAKVAALNTAVKVTDTGRVYTSDHDYKYGIMRARTTLAITGVDGMVQNRRVTAHVNYGITLENAQSDMRKLRENNPHLVLEGSFNIKL